MSRALRFVVLIRNLFLAAVAFVATSASPTFAEEKYIHPNSWGLDLREVGLVGENFYSDIRDRASIEGIYIKGNDIIVRVYKPVKPEEGSGKSFDVNFATKAISPAPPYTPYGAFGNEYKALKEGWAEYDGYLAGKGFDLCDHATLKSKVSFFSNPPLPYVEKDIFLLTRVRLDKPIAVKMIDHDGVGKVPCRVREVPPVPYLETRTRDLIISGQLRVVGLGDGTVLVWDGRWSTEIVRFRFDGTTEYKPHRLGLVDGGKIDALHEAVNYGPKRFLKGLDAILKEMGY